MIVQIADGSMANENRAMVLNKVFIANLALCGKNFFFASPKHILVKQIFHIPWNEKVWNKSICDSETVFDWKSYLKSHNDSKPCNLSAAENFCWAIKSDNSDKVW